MHVLQTINDVKECFELQKCYFSSEPYRSYDDRVKDLKKLKRLLLDNQDDFVEALNKDFGSPSLSDYLSRLKFNHYS
jgi:coniferyl-aldehyde dehydrogenase